MSWLSSFLHPERGYDNAQNTLNNYYNQGQGYLNPYNQNGQNQYGNLQEYINNLMHPEKLQDEWSKSYKESESAKNAEETAQQSGLNAANSMGLLGSNTALNAIQQGRSKIVADEKQNYLNDLMQKYINGANLVSGTYNTGANAATNQANNATTQGTNSANLQFGKTNAPGSTFGNLLGVGGSILGGYLGGHSGGWNLFGGK